MIVNVDMPSFVALGAVVVVVVAASPPVKPRSGICALSVTVLFGAWIISFFSVILLFFFTLKRKPAAFFFLHLSFKKKNGRRLQGPQRKLR